MNGDEARRFGEKSLADVQVTDLSSVLKSLRLIHPSNSQSTPSHFTITPLDTLLPPSNHPPILSLISPPPLHQPSGSGKTSLVTLIIATALSSPSTAIILLDPLQHFSIPLLTCTLIHILTSTLHPVPTAPVLKSMVRSALSHLHIFHPSTFPCLISTLRSLPSYLFDPTAHKSTQRRIHSLILEDADSLLPTLPTSTSPTSASATLTFHLLNLSSLLSCAVITTSRSTSPRYFRPSLPTSWPRDVSVTRIAVRKVEVKKFAAGLSVEEAEGEREARWGVVSKGRCEGWRVGGGGVQEGGSVGVGVGGGGGGGGGGGSGRFVIRIDQGVEMEKKVVK